MIVDDSFDAKSDQLGGLLVAVGVLSLVSGVLGVVRASADRINRAMSVMIRRLSRLEKVNVEENVAVEMK